MMCGRAAGLMMRPCDIQQLTTALRWKGCAWIRPQPHPRHYAITVPVYNIMNMTQCMRNIYSMFVT